MEAAWESEAAWEREIQMSGNAHIAHVPMEANRTARGIDCNDMVSSRTNENTPCEVDRC